MPRTRASKAASKGKAEAVESDDADSPQVNKLPPPAENPQRLFILPDVASESSYTITLNHPRSGKPSQYMICPETGLYEFTRITPPKSESRSWLLEPEERDGTVTISKEPDLFIATAIDPLFLLLPALYANGAGKSERMFLTLEHHLDNLSEDDANMAKVVASEKICSMFEEPIRQVCDVLEGGDDDENMYRLNETKLVECLLGKARSLADPALPASMEEKFVTSVLVAPVSNTRTSCPTGGDPAEGEPTEEAADGGSSSDPKTEEACGSADNTKAEGPSDDIVALQRQKVAFDFICSKYVSAKLTNHLKSLLSGPSKAALIDFTPLEEYMEQLARLKAEALAARSLVDYTSKRGLEDDEEAEERAEKKRKKEEEDKRKKANESRGVKELKKVNTTGMKKLSYFFTKK